MLTNFNSKEKILVYVSCVFKKGSQSINGTKTLQLASEIKSGWHYNNSKVMQYLWGCEFARTENLPDVAC